MSTLSQPDGDGLPQLSLAYSGEHPADAPDTPTLTESHYAQLEQLVRNSKPARRAAGYAHFSGWSTLLAGAFSLPFSLSNTPMLIFCVSIAAIGTRELSLRRRLLRLETTSLRKLAINQLLLAGVLIAYGVFMLMQAPGESMIASAMGQDATLASAPQIAAQLDGFARLEQLAKASVYALLILIALFMQGGAVLYYISKVRSLRRLHRQTPAWCVRVFQSVQA